VLDWYHLTRRLTVLGNVINSKDAAGQLRSREQDRISEWVESIKWRLWHGRPAKAIARLDALLNILDRPALADKTVVTRVRKLATDLRRYLNNNSDSLPDYGRRYRAGERISTAFV
nr:ISKra4 family transposase [Paraburkholderia terrae]